MDVLLDDPLHAAASASALRQAGEEGLLVLCEATLAEIVPVLGADELREFLNDWRIKFDASTEDSARHAGEMFRLYLSRGGKRGRIVPDFLIAAHAKLRTDRLLARDRGYYRDYFKDLVLWYPNTGIFKS
ncbi:MAG TPA: PIN domain-containing protein [Candidatus Limnocylindria bacterium]|nr:PIN domain-containing protein [Candidatus Limnocylindria bacterium]